eukprot:759574-Hanusia_phi.AAC.2
MTLEEREEWCTEGVERRRMGAGGWRTGVGQIGDFVIRRARGYSGIWCNCQIRWDNSILN